MASKQPWRSDLKSMTQTTHAAMFVWTVWPCFGKMIKKEEKKNLSLLELLTSPQLKIVSNQITSHTFMSVVHCSAGRADSP